MEIKRYTVVRVPNVLQSLGASFRRGEFKPGTVVDTIRTQEYGMCAAVTMENNIVMWFKFKDLQVASEYQNEEVIDG